MKGHADRTKHHQNHGTSGDDVGEAMLDLATRLYPLHRSQTGSGLRRTLEILSQEIPIQVSELASRQPVLDWEVPDEWELRDAFIADAQGERIVDYADSNLHVVNGSQPIRAEMTWETLQSHVHVIEDQPDAIPYRTCFFRDKWGFCVTHSQRDRLRQGGPWTVEIDARYFRGSMSLGECVLPGKSDQTVLIHCHTCHPSLANDNLSGIVVATFLAKQLQTMPRRYTYRLLFAPATIGVIGWLATQTPEQIGQIQHGLVLTLLGDEEPLTYKATRDGKRPVDSIVRQVLGRRDDRFRSLVFDPFGYDERQFNSPAFALPVGRLSRSIHGEFPEYHTSNDNLGLISAENLRDSLAAILEIVQAIEASRYPVNRKPYGEPMLGRYGVFKAFGQRDDRGDFQAAMMWILNLGDGRHCLENIVERSGLPAELIREVTDALVSHGLIDYHDYPDEPPFGCPTS